MKAAPHAFLVALALSTSSDARADAAALARNCAHCHGIAGTSSGSLIPSIGGQKEAYLKRVLLEFKNGQRPSVFMERLAKGYTDQELAAVAEHFARLDWSPPEQRTDPRLVDRGRELARERCMPCHGDSGSRTSGAVPLIAGQWADYLQDELARFASLQMKVPDPGMLQAMNGLRAADLQALAHFYASQGREGARP